MPGTTRRPGNISCEPSPTTESPGETPDRSTTVFAGQDAAATQRAREHFTGYAPSSPAIALLKDGQLVFMLERWQIEGRSAQEIARDLTGAFDEHCTSASQAA